MVRRCRRNFEWGSVSGPLAHSASGHATVTTLNTSSVPWLPSRSSHDLIAIGHESIRSVAVREMCFV